VTGCRAGGNTVTITPSSANFLRMVIAEYSGVASTGVVTDGSQSNIGTGTAVSSGTVATANTTDLLIGFTANQTADSVSFTPTSSFTVRNNQDGNLQLADLNTVAAGNFSFTGTDGSSVTWGAGVAAFKQGSSSNLYEGYGTNDSGGIALPAQEPSSTVFNTNPLSFLPAPVAGGPRGPVNSGVLYQGGGGGATTGFGQIFPTGRS